MPKPPVEDATTWRSRAPRRRTSRMSATGVIMTGPPPIPSVAPLATRGPTSPSAMRLSVVTRVLSDAAAAKSRNGVGRVGRRADDVRRVVVDQAPAAVVAALEDVGREHRRDGHALADLREDVLRAGDPGEVAHHLGEDLRDREAHLGRALEDGLPRGPHGLPADEERPAGMDALHVLAVGPDRLHLAEVERLEGAVEARVGLLDLLEVGHPDNFTARLAARRRSPRTAIGNFTARLAPRRRSPRTAIGNFTARLAPRRRSPRTAIGNFTRSGRRGCRSRRGAAAASAGRRRTVPRCRARCRAR